jgi:hypothetical protein
MQRQEYHPLPGGRAAAPTPIAVTTRFFDEQARGIATKRS